MEKGKSSKVKENDSQALQLGKDFGWMWLLRNN